MVNNGSTNVFSYSAQGLLGDAQIRGDIGQGDAIDQRGVFHHKFQITCCGVLRYQWTNTLQFLGQRFAGDFVDDMVPTDDRIRNFLPIRIGNHEQLAIRCSLYVFGGGHIFQIIEQMIFLYENLGDFFAFVVVIADTKNTFNNKTDLSQYLTCLHKIIVLLKFNYLGTTFNQFDLLWIQMAKLKEVFYKFIHTTKLSIVD